MVGVGRGGGWVQGVVVKSRKHSRKKLKQKAFENKLCALSNC